MPMGPLVFSNRLTMLISTASIQTQCHGLHLETNDIPKASTRSQCPTIRGSSEIDIQCQCPQRSSTHNGPLVSTLRHATMSMLSHIVNVKLSAGLQKSTYNVNVRNGHPPTTGTGLHHETRDNVHSVHPPTAGHCFPPWDTRQCPRFHT